MPKHEVKKPPYRVPGAYQYQSQMRELWAKVPLLENVPANGDLEVGQIAVFDAHSSTPSDYKMYMQTPDKIAVFDADILITGDTPGNLKKRYRRADSGKEKKEGDRLVDENEKLVEEALSPPSEESADDFPADTYDVWDKIPVLDSSPSHGDFEVAEMGILDAKSDDWCDYRVYCQVPDKVVVWIFCDAGAACDSTLDIVVPIELLCSSIRPTISQNWTRAAHNLDLTKYDGIVDIVFEIHTVGAGWVELTDSSFNTIAGTRITAASSGLHQVSVNGLVSSQQLRLKCELKDFIVQRARLLIYQEQATKTRIQIPFLMEAQNALPHTPAWGVYISAVTTRQDLPPTASWEFVKDESLWGNNRVQWMVEASYNRAAFFMWLKNKTTGNDVWGPFDVNSGQNPEYKTFSDTAANFTDGDTFVISIQKHSFYPWEPTEIYKINLYVDVEDLSTVRIFRRLFSHATSQRDSITPWSSSIDSTDYDLIDYNASDYCNPSITYTVQYQVVTGTGWQMSIHDSAHSTLTGSSVNLTSSSPVQTTSGAVSMTNDDLHGTTDNDSDPNKLHVGGAYLLIDSSLN